MAEWLKWRRMAQALQPDAIHGGGTDAMGRTVPWRMVQATIDQRGVPSMAPELLNYLETAGLEEYVAQRFAESAPELGALYAAWLRYRANFPGGHVSTVGKAAFAASRKVSLATFYRRLKQAEDFVISCVGERLQADIRKRQGEDGLHS
jgi:hypothetical protein